MNDIRKLLDIINETTAGATASGGVAPVSQSMHTQRRVEEDYSEESSDKPQMPQILEYGNWENSALTTSKKLKKSRKKASKIVKSVYGEDMPGEKKEVTEGSQLARTARKIIPGLGRMQAKMRADHEREQGRLAMSELPGRERKETEPDDEYWSTRAMGNRHYDRAKKFDKIASGVDESVDDEENVGDTEYTDINALKREVIRINRHMDEYQQEARWGRRHPDITDDDYEQLRQRRLEILSLIRKGHPASYIKRGDFVYYGPNQQGIVYDTYNRNKKGQAPVRVARVAFLLNDINGFFRNVKVKYLRLSRDKRGYTSNYRVDNLSNYLEKGDFVTYRNDKQGIVIDFSPNREMAKIAILSGIYSDVNVDKLQKNQNILTEVKLDELKFLSEFTRVKGVAETKVGNYKDLGATKSTTHFIKNVTTGKIVSPHRSRQDAEDALIANKQNSNDEFKIVRARKEGVAEGQSGKPIKPGRTFRFPNHWNKADVVHEFLWKKNAVVDVEYSYDTKKWTVTDSRPATEKDMEQWATINGGLPTVNEQVVAEGYKNTYEVGDRVNSPLGTGTITAVSKNVNVDGKVKVKLDDPSQAGEDGKHKDTYVLTTTQLTHISDVKENMTRRGFLGAMGAAALGAAGLTAAGSASARATDRYREIVAKATPLLRAGKTPDEVAKLLNIEIPQKKVVGTLGGDYGAILDAQQRLKQQQ